MVGLARAGWLAQLRLLLNYALILQDLSTPSSSFFDKEWQYVT